MKSRPKPARKLAFIDRPILPKAMIKKMQDSPMGKKMRGVGLGIEKMLGKKKR